MVDTSFYFKQVVIINIGFFHFLRNFVNPLVLLQRQIYMGSMQTKDYCLLLPATNVVFEQY